MKIKELLSKIKLKRATRLFLILALTSFLIITLGCYSFYTMKTDETKERTIEATKVHKIMSLYHCNDPRIFAAIMKTFDPVFVSIVIAVESEYNVDAISPAGCRGLMQLSPGKLEDWRNVSENIRIGARYLEKQMYRFGSPELALAAYNAGPESVVRHGGIPPYNETKSFIRRATYLSVILEQMVPLVEKPNRPVTGFLKSFSISDFLGLEHST